MPLTEMNYLWRVYVEAETGARCICICALHFSVYEDVYEDEIHRRGILPKYEDANLPMKVDAYSNGGKLGGGNIQIHE